MSRSRNWDCDRGCNHFAPHRIGYCILSNIILLKNKFDLKEVKNMYGYGGCGVAPVGTGVGAAIIAVAILILIALAVIF